ncbi:MAG: hypothetical protein U9N44_04180, partial [Chloroflexota bacterium]|nr:hypothetical protein [Chloroflexota bacterium]
SWSSMGLLWETKDAGATWELILSMTAMVPLPGLMFNSIEIPSSYPTDPSVFVNGPIDFYANPANLFIRSLDEGASFASTIGGPSIGATVQVVSAWAAIDKDTIIAASGSGVWKTTDAGAHWYQEDDTEVDAAETIIDLVLYDDTSVLIGTDQGNVYICDDWSTDFTFTQVDAGPGTVAADEARVAFDANFGDNGMIYAGINGDPTTAGVWRIDINSGDKWEQINDWGNILSIACADNGNLWAIADDGVVPFSTTMRCVSPTVDITKLAWEWVADDLTTNLVTDLELAPGSTHVFAIGNDGVQNIELWTYLDTLIKPTLLSPADGATAGDIIESDLWEGNARVLLTWEDFAKADLYQVQVALDEDFGSLVVDPTLTLAGTTAEVYLFLGEQYYWRVRVDEADPVYSQWSDTWSFFTPLGPGHARPILSSPTAGQEDVMLKPALQWSATVDATNYELIVAANCNWDDPVIDKTGAAKLGSETAFQITADLNEGTTYCWKVRGVSATTYSPWSDTGTFTTMTTPDVEEDSTPVWVWVVIALSAVLLVGVIVLIVRTRRPV